MVQEFTAAAFAEALAAGTLKEPIIREGIAKQSDKDTDSILFSEGLDCTHWIQVPTKIIEKVEFLHNVPCKDHEHPYVRIHLKSPSDNPEAEVFSDLLRGSTRRHSQSLGSNFASSAIWPGAQAVRMDPIGSLSDISSPQPLAGVAPVRLCLYAVYVRVPVATIGPGGTIIIKYIWVFDHYEVHPC